MTRILRNFPRGHLETDPAWQARETPVTGETDGDATEEHVAALVAAYESGEDVAPLDVVLMRDGRAALCDGRHRLLALDRLGRKHVDIRVLSSEVDVADVVLWACKANKANGAARSVADRRKAVRMLLAHRLGREFTLETVARHCGVSTDLVNSVRWEMDSDAMAAERDAREARARALGAAVAGRPSASTSAIARDVGASRSTVRAAREEYQRRMSRPDVYQGGDWREPVPESASPDMVTAADVGIGQGWRSEAEESERVARDLDVLADSVVSLRLSEALRDFAGQVRRTAPVECPRHRGEACGACGGLGYVRAEVADALEAWRGRLRSPERKRGG